MHEHAHIFPKTVATGWYISFLSNAWKLLEDKLNMQKWIFFFLLLILPLQFEKIASFNHQLNSGGAAYPFKLPILQIRWALSYSADGERVFPPLPFSITSPSLGMHSNAWLQVWLSFIYQSCGRSWQQRYFAQKVFFSSCKNLSPPTVLTPCRGHKGHFTCVFTCVRGSPAQWNCIIF